MRDELWNAIVNCDSSFDSQFFYGVRTTGIFCRPSCKSRTPQRAHIVIFSTSQEALEADFRPCKRCRPDQLRFPDAELVHRAITLIEQQYYKELTLPVISTMLHISTYHLHRTFKRIAGVTPSAYVQMKRIAVATELLAQDNLTVTDVAMMVGFTNSAHFSTVFRRNIGCTPTEFRRNAHCK